MEVATQFIITTTEAEAQALAKLCGRVNGAMMDEMKMSDPEKTAVAELYNELQVEIVDK